MQIQIKKQPQIQISNWVENPGGSLVAAEKKTNTLQFANAP